MTDMPDVDRLYREGVAAIRNGDYVAGREKLKQVVEISQTHEQAWLWLSAAVETDDERIICLENVLTINPDNQAARQGLAKLGAQIPDRPSPEPSQSKSPLIEHGAPASLDMRTQALLTGAVPPQKGEPNGAVESWRAPLLEQYAVEYGAMSDATLIEAQEKAPPRSIADLARAWLATSTFHVRGTYEEEIAAADVRHIGINLITIATLQIMAGIIPAILIFILYNGDFLAFFEPAIAFLEHVREIDFSTAFPQPIAGLIDGRLLGSAGELAARIRTFAPQIPDIFVQIGAGFIVATFAIALVGQMYRAMVISSIAGWFSRKGDVIKTMHALTMVLVVIQVVQLPLAILSPFLPTAIVIWVWVAIQIYRVALEIVALITVFQYELLFAFVTLVFSAVAVGLSVGLLLALPSLLPI